MSGVTSIIAASDLEAFGLSATDQHNFDVTILGLG